MRFNKVLLYFLFLCVWPDAYSISADNQNIQKQPSVYHFGKLTGGKITALLKIPYSKEIKINILSTEKGSEEIVFSFPLVSGSKYYPLDITAGSEHKLMIDFDLRYNFCKVFIDGEWLTSVLSRQQWTFINGISTECDKCNDEDVKFTDILADGKLLELTKPLKVVVFGNSTTAYRRTITGVYSQRMPEYFKEKNIPVQVFNEGIGGSHTGYVADNSLHKIRHARERFEDAVLNKEPDFVSFNFGINDSWVDGKDPEGKSRIPLEKYRENLLNMINTLRNKKISVVIMTPNAFGDNYEPWRHKRTEKYAKAVRRIAKKEKIPLIDQWKLMNKLASEPGRRIKDFLLPDEMHPNDLWHQILAERLSNLIIELNDSDGHSTMK